MARAWKTWLSRTAFLAVAAVALANAGCLIAAVGAAAGGAAAVSYAYYTAPLMREYPVNYADALAAVKTSLTELQFPLIKEQPDGASTLIETRTGDGLSVKIFLDVLTSPVPADGSLTRISVRVGHFGDDAVSARIQDQVAKHMPAPPPPAPSPGPVVANRPGGGRPVETVAPPLANPVVPAKRP
ncbi:MAG TPA: hypothetical protein DDY78_03950 [Planctomycetales bacterium]|jgi:hypothetical protein|nr:hypothetical protein [Planctomycetales bacterium]